MEKPRVPPLQTRTRFVPLLVLLFYVGTASYYFYIRFTETISNLPSHKGYAYFILAVELMGVSAFLPYALLLWKSTLSNKTAGLPGANAPQNQLPENMPRFQVKVLIPCYKEDLEVVTATVNAALDADLPTYCSRMVYLCDDGKSPAKREFVEGLQRDDVMYVSGRKRKSGEMNGKSANLNHCLKNFIYSHLRDNTGDIPKQRNLDISSSDIVVVFDADMVCKKNFFCKILEVMVDDRVGICVTPQAFHNINPDSDMFNAVNKQFWEYVLPGCDACGYIGCTGTNFALRARAIASVGWFPEFSITEDYALGMELAKNQWIGRYMNEYLAEGEAPDEPRNVFRQRSRWTKGHMQVFFSDRCPLFNMRLTMVNRLLYANGTWSYIVNTVTVPVFILVPFLSAVCNVHPLTINKHFVLAATLHFFAILQIQYFCRHPSHIISLWFSQLSNHVLWFTYTKAFWNALLSQLHLKQKMTFKATDKTATPAGQPPVTAAQRVRTMAHNMSLRASTMFRPGTSTSTANTQRTGTAPSQRVVFKPEEDEITAVSDMPEVDDLGVVTLNHVRLDMEGKAVNRYGGSTTPARGYPAVEPSAPPETDATVQLTPPRTPADLSLMAAGQTRTPSSTTSAARGSPAVPWRYATTADQSPRARGSPASRMPADSPGMLPLPPSSDKLNGSPNVGAMYLQKALGGLQQPGSRLATPDTSRPNTSPAQWPPMVNRGSPEKPFYGAGAPLPDAATLDPMGMPQARFEYEQFNQMPAAGVPVFSNAAGDQEAAVPPAIKEEEVPAPSCTEIVVSKLHLGGTWDAYVLVLSLVLSIATILAGVIRTAKEGTSNSAVFSVLPIFWAANNVIPPYLFLHYCFTKGDSFDWACAVCRTLSVVFTALAIATLWAAVYPLV